MPTTSIVFSEKDLALIQSLKEFYNFKTNSEVLRFLITKEVRDLETKGVTNE